MKLPPYFMVFDVESIGLHGEGFAFGYVLINAQGEVASKFEAACDPTKARGTAEDYAWVAANVPALPVTCDTPRKVREVFWEEWRYWAKKGAVLVADVAWPVEARFLAACVDDAAERHWDGPYPLHELTSIAMALGADVGTLWALRHDNELPAHNPLNDARQSARILTELLQRRPS